MGHTIDRRIVIMTIGMISIRRQNNRYQLMPKYFVPAPIRYHTIINGILNFMQPHDILLPGADPGVILP